MTTNDKIKEAVEKILKSWDCELIHNATDDVQELSRRDGFGIVQEAVRAGIELGKSELLDELEKIHSKVCLAQTIDDEHPEEDILTEECEECNWINKQHAKLKEAKR